MEQQDFHYCYFSFRGDGYKHELRVRVTPSMGLEWHLYVNDQEIGSMVDNTINIAMRDQMAVALSYTNVLAVYDQLLVHAKP